MFDPVTGQWVEDPSMAPPAADPSQTSFAPDGPDPSVAAAATAAPASPVDPSAAAAPAFAPPIDNSIDGAPHPFQPPDHWFAPQAPAGDQAPQDPYAQPSPDAISGGTAPDQQQQQAHQDYLGAIGGATVEPMQTADQHAAAVAGNQTYSLDDREKALNDSTLTPEQKAAVISHWSLDDQSDLRIKHEQTKLNWMATQQLAASQKAAADQAANIKLYQEAQQKAAADSAQREADAKKLAAQPIGHHIGIMEGIARVVLGAIGGAMSQYTGGHNLALEQFQKNVDEDVANQTANQANQWKGLDGRKTAISDELARHGDLYRAQETVRLAAYDRALGDIQTKAQDYDPAGTTAQRMADAHGQISAMRQKTIDTAAEQDFKQKLELGKSRLDALKEDRERDALSETERHNKAGEGLDWSKLSVEKDKNAAGKAADQVLTRDQFKAMGYTSVPPIPMSIKQWGGVVEGNAKAGEAAGKTTENAQKQSSGQVLNGAGDPYLKDGQPVQINPDVAKELNKRIGGGQEYIDEMGKVKRMLTADPSTFDREKWAELNSHLNTAAGAWTSMMGAKASSRELEAAKEVIGTDFDGYTARVKDKGTGIAAIGAQIDSTKRNLNTSLKREAGIKEGADLFDASEPPPSKETPADKVDKTLTQNFGAADVDPDTLNADDRAFAAAARGGLAGGPSALVANYAANNKLSPLVTRALHENIAPGQLQALDALETEIASGDDTARAAAVDRLDKIAKGSKSKAVRTYIQSMFNKGAGDVVDSIAGSPEVVR